jgi:hypothetical protein
MHGLEWEFGITSNSGAIAGNSLTNLYNCTISSNQWCLLSFQCDSGTRLLRH